jgi:hypothetical protein
VRADAAELAALAERVTQLEAIVEDLQERLMQATEAEWIIRRAGYPETMLYGVGRRQAPPRGRRGHLHAVGKSQPAG